MTVGYADRGYLPAVHEAWLPREHPLHRPRHGTKQILALVCAAAFFATPLLALGLGARPAEIENRPLVEFPDAAQGWGFFTGLSTWASDHVVFRKDAMAIADDISRGIFGEPPRFEREQNHVGVVVPPVPQREKNAEAAAVPNAIEGKSGWLYYGDDVASKCNQVMTVSDTLTQLRRLRDGVEASGRTFVLIVAPDKTTIVPEYLPSNYIGKECSRRVTEDFWRRFSGETGGIDIRAQLHTSGRELGRPVYPPLDGHWSDEGGIVLTRTLAEAIRPGVSETWSLTPTTSWEVPGDLPPLIGHSGTVKGQSYSLKPDGQRDQTRELSADFASPRTLNTATGPGTIGNRVGYLGDSFSIRAFRYLAATFSNLTVMHYGDVRKDHGRTAGRLLAENEVVAIEIVERTLGSGNSAMVDPVVVDGIIQELTARPLHR